MATPQNAHPKYRIWADDEAKMRATYHASSRGMAPYLVPHRFEAAEGTKPSELPRAKYSYCPKVNAAWVKEQMGHVRTAAARYTWGDMEEVDTATLQKREQAGEPAITGRPAGGVAQMLWDDVTLTGTPWRKFYGRKVLEWLLTSPGGFVLVDSPNIPGSMTKLEERRAGRRPYHRWIPMSKVTDLEPGGFGFGFLWIEFQEDRGVRKPQGREQDEGGPDEVRVLYELDENGRTIVTRRTPEGQAIEESIDLGRFEDPQGFPVLPLIPAMLGEHPEIEWLGQGIIYGLHDNVAAMYNALSETHEGFRDGTFTVHWYKGDHGDEVKTQMDNGSRYLDLGSGDDAAVGRLEGGGGEVDSGLAIADKAAEDWQIGAKGKIADAMEGADARTGVSLKAEYQLSTKPLLTEIAEALDEVETNAMWVTAQMVGLTPEKSQEVGVARDTSFQMEDEVSRISRIAKEFADSMPIPPTLLVALGMKWAEASGVIDMEAEIETAGGKVPARDVLRAEFEELADARKRRETERGDLFGFGGFDARGEMDRMAEEPEEEQAEAARPRR